PRERHVLACPARRARGPSEFNTISSWPRCLCLGTTPPGEISSVPNHIFCEPPFLRSTLIVNTPVGTGICLALRTRCSPSLFSRMSGVIVLSLADWGCASFNAIPYVPTSIVLRLSTWSPNRIVSSQSYVMGRIRARTVSRVLEDPASLSSYCGYTGRLLGFFLPSFLERLDLSRIAPRIVPPTVSNARSENS